MCGLWWRYVMPGYDVYSVSVVKIIKGGKTIISDGLSLVGIELLVCGEIGQVFLNFTDVNGSVHGAYPTHFVESFNDQIQI